MNSKDDCCRCGSKELSCLNLSPEQKIEYDAHEKWMLDNPDHDTFMPAWMFCPIVRSKYVKKPFPIMKSRYSSADKIFYGECIIGDVSTIIPDR